jgi:tripartite ATP-independent transporter DctP family solute receptor
MTMAVPHTTRRRAAGLFAFIAITSAIPIQNALAQSPQTLRISNQLPATAAVTRGLDLWKKKVEAATKLKVEIYNNSQLYRDDEVFPAVKNHSVDMGLVISAQFTAYDPIFSIFDLPGLFQSYEHATTALRGRMGEVLTKHLHALGVHPLYWPQQGFSAIATTKRVLKAPEDFKRLKLRAHSKSLARMFQLLGAAPTVIAASEVTTAASRGTIDGFSTSLSSYYSRKWFENAPNINHSRFGLIGAVIIINKDLWDKLGPEEKAAIEEASREAETFSTNAVISEEQSILSELAGKGVTETAFDKAARDSFTKIVAPMRAEYAESSGKDGKELLDYVNSIAP